LKKKMRYLLKTLSLLLCFPVFVQGQQIISPDTVCVNEPVSFLVNGGGRHITTYAWEFGTTSMTPILATAIPVPGTGRVGSGATGMFDIAGGVTMAYDAGNYYAFVTSARNFSVQRLEFGSDPNGSPTVVNLGNPGGTIRVLNTHPNTALIDIVKDGNLWYGFIADKEALIRLEFGTSLANAPTATRMAFPMIMEFGMQLTVLKFDNEWIAFCGNVGDSWWGGSTLRTHYIHRFDFGPSLTNTPTATILPNYNQLSEPLYFSLVEEQGQWYMFVANQMGAWGNTLARYSFGTNLKNNNPTLVNMGNPGGFNWPRSISTIRGCDTFYAVQQNENGTVNALDFHNNVLNTPTGVSLGNGYSATGMGTHVFRPYWYNDTLWVITANFSSLATANVYRLPLLCIPSGNAVIKYYDSTASYTFTSPGVYNVTVYCDQADQRGAYAFCKQVVVLGKERDFLGSDTTLCLGETYTISGAHVPADSFIWSTGERTKSISVKQSGSYWLQVSGGICLSADTVQVQFEALPVDLGPDIAICPGETLTLSSAGTFINPTYLWSIGLTGSSVTIDRADTYWLHVQEPGGCTGSDTIVVSMKERPVFSLGPDTTICSHRPLRIGDNIAGASSRWNTGAVTPFIEVTTSGVYALEMDLNGCVASDTIEVTAINTFLPDLGPDRNICEEEELMLSAGGGPEHSFVWNTGATTSDITVATPGSYWVEVVTGDRCIASDTVELQGAQRPWVKLGPDTVVCEETPLLLRPFVLNADRLLWSDGSETETLEIGFGGTYLVTAYNECGTASDTINIRQIFCDIRMPNAFTPNGDGKNDVFRAMGNLGRLDRFELSLYDRWGQCVFRTTDRYQGWDGQFEGAPAIQGTYVYMLEYDLEGKPFLEKGNFHLLR
jgi:gliding motility-associated-like protein